MSQENVRYVPMSICLSNQCDRGCSHCDAEASMDGCLLTVEQAHLLAKKSTEYAAQTKENEGVDLRFDFTVTGNGESLLNPDFPEIVRILFSECPTDEVRIVTSGINSKNPEEEKRVLEILREPFANRLLFSLSFNIFQRGFPKRLLRTMKLLYENGVDYIDIKIVLTHRYVYRTIHRLNRLIVGYFLPFVKEINPLADEGTFSPINLESGLEDKIKELPYPKAVVTLDDEQQRLTEAMTKIRSLTGWDLGEWFVFFQTNFSGTYQFETRWGKKSFTYRPQYLVKRGRARNLQRYLLPYQEHKRPCWFMTEQKYTKLHVGADGYYYPSCDCPNNTALRIGYVGDDMDEVIKRFFYLKYLLIYYIVRDKRHYETICDHCVLVMEKMRRLGILKDIGIDCPQEDGPSKLITFN